MVSPMRKPSNSMDFEKGMHLTWDRTKLSGDIHGVSLCLLHGGKVRCDAHVVIQVQVHILFFRGGE